MKKEEKELRNDIMSLAKKLFKKNKGIDILHIIATPKKLNQFSQCNGIVIKREKRK